MAAEPGLFVEIVQLFLDDAGAALCLLPEQLSANEFGDAVRRTLHGLKGSCRQIGALALGDMLEEMESMTSTGRCGTAVGRLPSVREAFHRVRLQIGAAIEEQQSAAVPTGERL